LTTHELVTGFTITLVVSERDTPSEPVAVSVYDCVLLSVPVETVPFAPKLPLIPETVVVVQPLVFQESVELEPAEICDGLAVKDVIAHEGVTAAPFTRKETTTEPW
jgi:hypothetical protein